MADDLDIPGRLEEWSSDETLLGDEQWLLSCAAAEIRRLRQELDEMRKDRDEFRRALMQQREETGLW